MKECFVATGFYCYKAIRFHESNAFGNETLLPTRKNLEP